MNLKRLLSSCTPILIGGTLLAAAALALPRAVPGLLVTAAQAAEAGQALVDFRQPFLFAYGSWDKKVKTQDGVALLRGEGVTGQGGGGFNANLDWKARAVQMPVLRVRVGAQNRVRELIIRVGDDKDAWSMWNFVLPAPGSEWATLSPRDGATLAEPNTREKGVLDLGRIRQWQLQGNWDAGPLDVEVQSVVAVPPDAAALQARQAKADREKQEADRIAREQQQQRDQFKPGTPLSPRLAHVSLAAPDILSLEIISGRITRGKLAPYAAQSGDEKDEKKDKAGKVNSIILKRGGQEIGYLIGPRRDQLVTMEQFTGDPLLTFVAAEASNYRVSSVEDAAYRTAAQPTAVYRKSKPLDWAQPGRGFIMRHTVLLRLPHPLQKGRSYSVSLGALNTDVSSVKFTPDASRVPSESVHVNQIGYRPDDPVKRAFLSLWLGTGGGYKFPSGLGFAVVDARTGKQALAGKVEMAKAASEPEKMWKDKNYNKTDVYRMDFSALTAPGRYRIVVDGVGTSYPFDIAPSVWERALKVQMMGLYNQRSGVAIGPPYSDYVKPRDFYPGDGAQVFQSTYSVMDGPGESPRLAAGSTGVPVPEAWGGYHDAGDWNPRRVTHMSLTMAQLEIFELFPRYFERLDLNIPKTPGLPDMLTEALFEIDCFRRLQKPDGGVPYGIETDGDPIAGEVSWLQSMPAYVYAPDARSSFFYAGVAARAARLLQHYNAKLAGVYQESALRAMNWAEAEYAKLKAAGDEKRLGSSGLDARNLAALELLFLTRESRWHDVFLQDSFLARPGGKVFANGRFERDAAFLYARMDSRWTDPALRAKARQATIGQAEDALVYAANNAWNLTTPDKGMPMFQGFYTTPGATELGRAHFLTQDARYLRGVVQSTQYQSGANPTNMTFTTGLGANPIQNPLRLDPRLSGQKAPIGITVYGPRDSDWEDWSKWVFDYFLNKELVPAIGEWPVTESYFDIYLYVSTNEYTVDIWAPNIWVWGYLAARK